MTSGGVFVGYECKPCGVVVGTAAVVSAGGEAKPLCSNCGKKMTPMSGPNAPEMVTNFQCPKCNTTIGAIVSTGPINTCPQCGAPIE